MVDKKAIKQKYTVHYKLSKEDLKNLDLKKLYYSLKDKYFKNRDMSSFENVKWNNKFSAIAGREKGGLIELSSKYHQKYPDEIVSTLLHEMIHLYISGHPDSFYDELDRINNIAQKEIVTRHSKEKAHVRYVGVCPNHDDIDTRAKAPRDNLIYRCNKCKSEIDWIVVNRKNRKEVN